MDRNLEERRPVNLQDRVYAIATARRGLRSALCTLQYILSAMPMCLCISADFVRHVLQQQRLLLVSSYTGVLAHAAI